MEHLKWTFLRLSEFKVWLQMKGWPVVSLVMCSCSWSTRLTNRQRANDPAISVDFGLCSQERYGSGRLSRFPSAIVMLEGIKAAIRVTPHLVIYKCPSSLLPTLGAPHLKLV